MSCLTGTDAVLSLCRSVIHIDLGTSKIIPDDDSIENLCTHDVTDADGY